ncbi:hypothetical protein [Protofrankia coriariae]|uniref:hypothetical protein n=1 Tax=Protofrankia coriariae TaxID=1562887 RepID=UPI00138ECCCF|nr:hypothetical protein [Protofrankia coriariae]
MTGIVLRCRDHRRPKTGLDAYRIPPRELCERCRVISLPRLSTPVEPDPPKPGPFRPFWEPV